MIATNYSNVRNNLKKYCDKIIDLLKNRDFIIRIDDKLQFSKKLKKDL